MAGECRAPAGPGFGLGDRRALAIQLRGRHRNDELCEVRKEPRPRITSVSAMAVHRRTLPVMVSSTFVVAWTVWWAWRMWPDSGVSWHFSVDGANLLLHGSGLNLYADAPWLQTGPLSLVVAALLSPLPANVAKNIALVAMTAAGPLLIAALAPLVAPTRRGRRMLIAAIIDTSLDGAVGALGAPRRRPRDVLGDRGSASCLR